MDLRALRYFEAVYEQRSISAASRVCFVAQPSISAAVQQLESTLGVTLFTRHPKGVTPTEAGERLYPLAKQLTGQAKAIQQLFADKPAPVPFRLGLMRSPGVERISLLLKELSAAVESLELTLVNPEEPSDARIVFHSEVKTGEAFQPLWEDRYQLALPIGHPLSLKERVAVADLQDLPFISRHPCAALEQLKRLLEAEQVAFVTRANTRTIEYALGLVAAGIGAAWMPDWESIEAREDVILRPVEGVDLYLQVGLVFDPHAAPSLPLEAAIALCRERWQARGT